MQHMDCKEAINTLAQPTYKPGQNMVTVADLLIACVQLESTTSPTFTEAWVMGSVSEKKKDDPNTITNLEHDNSECNLDAEQCIQQG